MITEAMIRAATVGGIALFWSEITYKAIKICQTIIFPPKIPLWSRCEYCSNYFTSDLLSEREGINCYICDPICENPALEISRKCIENALKNALKMRYNVFQPVGNAFQPAVIISECVGNVS